MDYKIPVTSDFTRLTLDTIALCAMDFRFNSFYQEDLHPFVVAMTNMLASRSNAGQLSGILQRLLTPSYNAQLEKDVQYMRTVSNELVQHRRDNPTEKKDLLNAMIYGKDPKTGSTMRDDLIAANMQTFLVAGTSASSSPVRSDIYRSRDHVRASIICLSQHAQEPVHIFRCSAGGRPCDWAQPHRTQTPQRSEVHQRSSPRDTEAHSDGPGHHAWLQARETRTTLLITPPLPCNIFRALLLSQVYE